MIMFGEEAGIFRYREGQAAELTDEVEQGGRVGGPTARTDVGPKSGFALIDDADTDAIRQRRTLQRFDGLDENAAVFDGAIAADAETIGKRDAGEWTDFVYDGGLAIEEKGFDLIESAIRSFLEDAEAKGLREGRVGAIVDGDCTHAFKPCSITGAVESMACFDRAAAGAAFRTFEAPGEREISKDRHNGYGIIRSISAGREVDRDLLRLIFICRVACRCDLDLCETGCDRLELAAFDGGDFPGRADTKAIGVCGSYIGIHDEAMPVEVETCEFHTRAWIAILWVRGRKDQGNSAVVFDFAVAAAR